MAIFSNEWVLVAAGVTVLFAGAAVWHRTRKWFKSEDEKDA